jgi:hypothetical protein
LSKLLTGFQCSARQVGVATAHGDCPAEIRIGLAGSKPERGSDLPAAVRQVWPTGVAVRATRHGACNVSGRTRPQLTLARNLAAWKEDLK